MAQDADDDDAPLQPGLFLQNLLGGVQMGSAKTPEGGANMNAGGEQHPVRILFKFHCPQLNNRLYY